MEVWNWNWREVMLLPFLAWIPLCSLSLHSLSSSSSHSHLYNYWVKLLFNSRGSLCTKLGSLIQFLSLMQKWTAFALTDLAERKQIGPFLFQVLQRRPLGSPGWEPLLLELRKEEYFGSGDWEGWWAKTQGWSFKQQNFPSQVWGDRVFLSLELSFLLPTGSVL